MFGLLFNHGKVCNLLLNSINTKLHFLNFFILHKRTFKIQKPHKSQYNHPFTLIFTPPPSSMHPSFLVFFGSNFWNDDTMDDPLYDTNLITQLCYSIHVHLNIDDDQYDHKDDTMPHNNNYKTPHELKEFIMATDRLTLFKLSVAILNCF